MKHLDLNRRKTRQHFKKQSDLHIKHFISRDFRNPIQECLQQNQYPKQENKTTVIICLKDHYERNQKQNQ